MTYMMKQINDELAYMAKLLDKAKQEVHELQHFQVIDQDYERLEKNAQKLTSILFDIHLLAEDFKVRYRVPLPEIDLRQAANNDLIQKLRHIGTHGD